MADADYTLIQHRPAQQFVSLVAAIRRAEIGLVEVDGWNGFGRGKVQDADGPVAFGLDSLQLVVRECDILAFGILVALDDLVGLHLRAGVLTHLLLTDAHAVPSEFG